MPEYKCYLTGLLLLPLGLLLSLVLLFLLVLRLLLLLLLLAQAPAAVGFCCRSLGAAVAAAADGAAVCVAAACYWSLTPALHQHIALLGCIIWVSFGWGAVCCLQTGSRAPHQSLTAHPHRRKPRGRSLVNPAGEELLQPRHRQQQQRNQQRRQGERLQPQLQRRLLTAAAAAVEMQQQ